MQPARDRRGEQRDGEDHDRSHAATQHGEIGQEFRVIAVDRDRVGSGPDSMVAWSGCSAAKRAAFAIVRLQLGQQRQRQGSRP